jgi:CheY-like chemotaxis protein
MKLLIVDDSSEMRYMLRNLCEHLFDKIIECEDGESALNACIKEKPDIILMDIKMKKIDGFSATRLIRRYIPGMKIIMVSQFVDESFREEAYRAGALNYVSKDDLTKLEPVIIKIINH